MSRDIALPPPSDGGYSDHGSERAVPLNPNMMPLPPSLYSPSPRSKANARHLEDMAGSEVDYEGGVQPNGANGQYARSDVQEGQQSPNLSPVELLNFGTVCTTRSKHLQSTSDALRRLDL